MKKTTVKKYVKQALKFLNEKNWTRHAMIRFANIDESGQFFYDDVCKFCISGAAAYLYLKTGKKKMTENIIVETGNKFHYAFKKFHNKGNAFALANPGLVGLNDTSADVHDMKKSVSGALKTF